MKETKRPWGSFKIILRSPQLWVKVIKIKKNQQTSLQYHHFRTEYHAVLSGEVHFTIGNRVIQLKDGAVTIPHGVVHRIKCVGNKDAKVVEVAYGNPKESDIVRVEDDYGRAKHRGIK